MALVLTVSLRDEYTQLFDTCDIRPAKLALVDAITAIIAANKNRYEQVSNPLGIPWFVTALLHNMEASLKFTGHLHNGDPLTARTSHVPPNRPASGQPPFTWEESATDALKLEKMDTVQDWSLPNLLFQMEKFNGLGYRTRHPEVLTPYLWSFSNHYTAGKYVADGTFDPDAVSKQCGAAVVLRRLAEQGTVQFGPSTAIDEPMVVYSETEESEAARSLQRALNQLPGVFVLVDGVPGKRTSDAFFKATGHFLKGDPRS